MSITPRLKRKPAWALCSAALLMVTSCSRTDGTSAVRQDDAAFDAFVQTAMTKWETPGVAVSLVRDGTIVSAKGYGVRTIGAPAAVDENTTFAIASLTKAFTAAALATLADQKKVSWDDQVADFLPDLKLYAPKVTAELTVRDLLAQRTCLQSKDLLTWQSPFSLEETLRRLQFLPAACTFRDRFVYNNVNYVLAGEVAARASGQSWTELIEAGLFAPLGMTRSVAQTPKVATGDNVATPYIRTGGKLRALPLYDEGVSAAAGSIHSTAADMARWLEVQLGSGAFRGTQVWSRSANSAMQGLQMAIPTGPVSDADPPLPRPLGYGFGWGVDEYRGERMLQHTGQSDGMYAIAAMMPGRKLGIVVMTNTSSAGLAQAIAYQWLDLNLNAPTHDWITTMYAQFKDSNDAIDIDGVTRGVARTAGTRPSLPAAAYAGLYRNDLLGDVSISTDPSGQMFVRFLAHTGAMRHWHHDTFQIDWQGDPYYTMMASFMTFAVNGQSSPASVQIGVENDTFARVAGPRP